MAVDDMALGYMEARRDQWAHPMRFGPRTIARRLGILLRSPDRFWARVDRSGDGCGEWQGPTAKSGYGQASYDYAHRVAYALVYGPIPKGPGYHGFCVCHRCDNPRCCNPSHLFLGTQAENIADRHAKGRTRGPHTKSRAA